MQNTPCPVQRHDKLNCNIHHRGHCGLCGRLRIQGKKAGRKVHRLPPVPQLRRLQGLLLGLRRPHRIKNFSRRRYIFLQCRERGSGQKSLPFSFFQSAENTSSAACFFHISIKIIRDLCEITKTRTNLGCFCCLRYIIISAEYPTMHIFRSFSCPIFPSFFSPPSG